MRTHRLRFAVAVFGAALLSLGLAQPFAAATPMSDVPGGSMTRVQARQAYLDAVCPMNAVILTFATAASADQPDLATMRKLGRALAVQTIRTATELQHPARPWPANVREEILDIADADLLSAGRFQVLSRSNSLEIWDSLWQTEFPGIDQLVKTTTTVRSALGLPPASAPRGGCPK